LEEMSSGSKRVQPYLFTAYPRISAKTGTDPIAPDLFF
jgi:hypothetical protein